MKKPNWTAHLEHGTFDAILAAGMIAIVVLYNAIDGDLLTAIIDVIAFSAAALTYRWPRVAGTVMLAAVFSLLFASLASMGEMAPLIPILGMGMRGRRRQRLWMTVGYAVVLIPRMIQDSWGYPLVTQLLGMAMYAILVGLLWLIGNLFESYRRALEQTALATVQLHRVSVARELHDTVARDLARAALQLGIAQQRNDSAELRDAAALVRRASADLRSTLVLLRTPSSESLLPEGSSSLIEAIGEECGRLRALGFDVTLTIEGDSAAVLTDAEASLALIAGAREAAANIERHGSVDQPCQVFVSADPNAESIEVAFFNGMGDPKPGASSPSLGLTGIRERLAVAGGTLVAEQQGSQWSFRMTAPVRKLQLTA